MKIYYTVIAIGAIVVIYFISALTPLHWYMYLPFIAVFVVVFYWDELTRLFPALGRWRLSRKPRNAGRGNRKKNRHFIRGKRM